MDLLIDPELLHPVDAYRGRIDGVMELLEERVTAVQIAWEAVKANNQQIIPMPDGGAIFETTGRWEEYSTPARDLRLLIAIDELRAFPDHVAAAPGRFRIAKGTSAAEVQRALRNTWDDTKDLLYIEYQNSAGTLQRLTLARIMERIGQLEQAYNPNDCPEARWAAVPGTAEFASCKRRAPGDQRARMARYRFWHAERRRPSGF